MAIITRNSDSINAYPISCFSDLGVLMSHLVEGQTFFWDQEFQEECF